METTTHSTNEGQFENIIRQAPIAIGIMKGEDFVIEMANDHLLELWGKTSKVIGLPLLDGLPEIADQPFPGLLAEVYRTGIPYNGTEMKAVLERNGVLEDCYFNLIYSPVRDNNNKINGVMVIASEVSSQVKAKIELEESEERFRNLVLDAPMATALYTGREMVIHLANEAMLNVWGKSKSVIGMNLKDALPELDGQPFHDLLLQVFNSGIAHQSDEARADLLVDGNIRSYYFNFTYKPLFNSAGEVYAILNMAVDITSQVHARQAVQESERRLRYMTDAMPQQVWTAKANGELNFVNQKVCEYFGRTEEEIIGNGWQQFIHPDDLEECLKTWLHCLQSGETYTIEFRLQDTHGDYKWHLGRALPLINDGVITQWFGTNTYIHDQKILDQKKDEFLSIASHELKTPLTSIKAYNQLMQKGHDLDKINMLISKSASHINRLERLISDLLDVTKINAGKMVYNMQDFNFNEVLTESIESVQHTSPTHQIILDQSADIIVNGDKMRIEQVINNFLTNAVKYSPEADRVIISSRVEHNNLIVSVQDFGIGIPAKDLDRLFERYFRADNSAMRFEGLGLGLFIASEILRRHKGSFWIESRQGEGSIFSFRLPLSEISAIQSPVSTDICYEDNSVRISYKREGKYIDINWFGFQNFETVKNGTLTLVDIIKEKGCVKVLNNNTQVLGTWSEASEWAATEGYPRLEAAGLKHLAWVNSASTFSQLSVKKSLDLSEGNINTQVFYDKETALKWLVEI